MRFLLALILLSPSANAGSKLYVNMLNAGVMGNAQATDGVDTTYLTNSAIQAIYTGTPVGTMVVQASNDNTPAGTTSSAVVNWVDVPNTSTSPSISTSGSLFVLQNVGYRWVRLKYTPSGSLPQSCNGCTLTVNFFGKGN